MRVTAIVIFAGTASGCFSAPDYASKEDIRKAAERCGISTLEPAKAGPPYQVQVPANLPDAPEKQHCIDIDLASQGLFVAEQK